MEHRRCHACRPVEPGAPRHLADRARRHQGDAQLGQDRNRQARSGRPIGRASATLAGIVTPADEALSLEALNRDFNPFLGDPRGPDGKPLLGPFQSGGELYEGKTFLPVRFIVAKMAESGGVPSSRDQAADRRSERGRADSHAGSSVPPGAWPRQSRGVLWRDHGQRRRRSISATPISTRSVIELAKQNLRLIKQMVHFDRPAQGGSPEDIVADGAAGATHAGGFSAGFNIDGSPMAIKSDWPSNYGQLGNNNKTYNAHLIAIDYSAGVEDQIPEETLKAYYRNADMWDCASAILVPFADQDPDPKYPRLHVQPARSVRPAIGARRSGGARHARRAHLLREARRVLLRRGPIRRRQSRPAGGRGRRHAAEEEPLRRHRVRSADRQFHQGAGL